MVQRAMKFTPEVLLSAPRRSAGLPNPSGTKVLYTTSTYSFKTHKKTIELRGLQVDSGESHTLSTGDEISDLAWVNDDEVVYLLGGAEGSTNVYWATTKSGSAFSWDSYVAGTIDGPAGDLKVKQLDDNSCAIVVSAQSNKDGTLYNPEKAKKTHSTGKLYSGLFVRHWDKWETQEKNSLWYGKLSKKSETGGRYKLSLLHNALKGTGLESPIRPFGGTDNFDISTTRIILVAKDPTLNPALNTHCGIYIANIRDWEGKAQPSLLGVGTGEYQGAASSPVFSPDGTKIAFLKMRKNGYEADRNTIFLTGSIPPVSIQAQPLSLVDAKWDISPQSLTFSADGSNLLLVAEHIGAQKVFQIHPSLAPPVVRTLTQHGSISDVHALPEGRVFVSGSSITDNSFYAIIDSKPDSTQLWKNSNSTEGSKFGLKSSQVSYIWTPASNPKINKEVQSIVLRPSNFDSSKKYPVAYLIHGGPQGAWADSWSTRWNPAIFAEQGYIVVAPNPTGSTGYGQAFTDAIRKNWGGDPYQDIVNVFEWVGKNIKEADNDRAVALGGSYGGYMMNWIQGHDLGRKFKCLVCHDGITSFAGGLLGTEELYFPFHDLGATPRYDPGFEPASNDASPTAQAYRNFGAAPLSEWRKWDPSEHFANWATPQLVIHSSKDYRLPIAEGLAAFNVLQARKVDSQLLQFDDENHWVLKPENSLLWHKVVLNWINKHAGLKAFTDEAEDSVEFYGGLKQSDEEGAEMPTQGKVEM